MNGRHHLLDEMDVLSKDVLKMGTLVEEALNKALIVLRTLDEELARTIISEDSRINDFQLHLEDMCAKIIATEQPVASNLRDILTTLKVVSNIERIGDHAVHLSKSMIRIQDKSIFKKIGLLDEMLNIGIGMLHDVLDAFVDHNEELAREIASRDANIDNLHKQVISNTLEYMRQNPRAVEDGTAVLFLNRFLERMGDHVANICEYIVFATSGNHVELNM